MNIITLFSFSNQITDSNKHIALTIGNIQIAWYAIFILIGFFVATLFSFLKIHFIYKIPSEPLYYFVFICLPISILGARTWSFIIGDAKVYNNFFIDFWNFKGGGLAIHGGVIASIIAALIFFPLILKLPKYNIKVKKDNIISIRQVSTFVYFDAVVPTILIGQVIGRWGNFMNAELFGSIVENPENSFEWLKILMPDVYNNMFIRENNGELFFRHPLFLYESFFNFLNFIFLYVIAEFIHKRKAGDQAAGYAILYGILRLCMEPFREANFMFIASIITSILMIVFGIIFIIINHLFLVKKRDTKMVLLIFVTIYSYILKTYSLCSKKFKKYIKENDPKWENYGFKRQIIIKRDKNNFLYYNNL